MPGYPNAHPAAVTRGLRDAAQAASTDRLPLVSHRRSVCAPAKGDTLTFPKLPLHPLPQPVQDPACGLLSPHSPLPGQSSWLTSHGSFSKEPCLVNPRSLETPDSPFRGTPSHLPHGLTVFYSVFQECEPLSWEAANPQGAVITPNLGLHDLTAPSKVPHVATFDHQWLSGK